MSTISVNDTLLVNPIDALWTLFKSQPKAVREAFTKRLIEEDVKAATLRQQQLVRNSVLQAVEELKEAEKHNFESLQDARTLFAEWRSSRSNL